MPLNTYISGNNGDLTQNTIRASSV